MVQALIPGTMGATPQIVNDVFGEKLRQMRRLRNLSQTELGELVRLSRVTIANIEGGKQNVQLHQVFAFAMALDAAGRTTNTLDCGTRATMEGLRSR